MSKRESASIYNPFNNKGLEVPASIIGLIGFGFAVIGTLIGLCVIAEVEPEMPKFVGDMTGNRFMTGMMIIIMANINGILILGLGKVFHFFSTMIQQNEAILAELRKNGSHH